MVRRSAARAPMLALAGLSVVAACSRGQVNEGGRYCAALQENQVLIDAPIRSSTEIEPRISIYETLRDQAPLDVEEQWQRVINLVRAAARVDVSDPAAMADVTDLALSTAQSAQEIVEHAARLCGVTLTPPGEIPVPEVTISVPDTTATAAITTTATTTG